MNISYVIEELKARQFTVKEMNETTFSQSPQIHEYFNGKIEAYKTAIEILTSKDNQLSKINRIMNMAQKFKSIIDKNRRINGHCHAYTTVLNLINREHKNLNIYRKMVDIES